MATSFQRPNRDSSMNRREVVCLPRREPKPDPGTPAIVALLKKALDWKAAMDAGEARSLAALGRGVGVTGQRVGHMVWLARRIEPALAATVLALPPGTPQRVVTVKELVRTVRAGRSRQLALIATLQKVACAARQ